MLKPKGLSQDALIRLSCGGALEHFQLRRPAFSFSIFPAGQVCCMRPTVPLILATWAVSRLPHSCVAGSGGLSWTLLWPSLCQSAGSAS